MKTLIAGVGNVLRGDDGFGVRVAQRLEVLSLPDGVRLVEVGISGVALVQELMAGYDACIIIDTADRGGAPGTLYLLEPEIESPSVTDAERLHRELVDMHYAAPSRALRLAAALGARPTQTYLLACQPATMDSFAETMSPAVERAVEEAVRMILEVVSQLQQKSLEEKKRKEEP